jgi:hypothetical protein
MQSSPFSASLVEGFMPKDYADTEGRNQASIFPNTVAASKRGWLNPDGSLRSRDRTQAAEVY